MYGSGTDPVPAAAGMVCRLPCGRCGKDERGFSLVEAIVAIALVGSAIIIASAFLNTLLISSDHLRMQEGLLSELEAAGEMMRAGILPLQSGPLAVGGYSGNTPGLSLTAIVEERQPRGLYQVSLRAECSFRHRRISRTLVTEIWRP